MWWQKAYISKTENWNQRKINKKSVLAVGDSMVNGMKKVNFEYHRTIHTRVYIEDIESNLDELL